MVARHLLLVWLLLLTGCRVINQQPEVIKIALLAPFEGRYREVGYDALYAARLALIESGVENIDLLAIDDGGSVEAAVDRAHAILQDPTIAVTLVLGIHAASSEVQAAFAEHPVLIIGHWNTQPTGENVSILASSEIDSQLTNPQPSSVTVLNDLEMPIVGSELLALQQLPLLYENLSNITILSSATLPDTDFIQRYATSDTFALQPGLLATPTYDATRLAIASIISTTPLRDMTYEGMNGTIRFDSDGYWHNAPVYEYAYENGELVRQQ